MIPGTSERLPAEVSYRAALAHYGIDPTDRKYQGGGGVADWCKTCGLHSMANPSVRCDLERARAADLEAEGYEVHHCAHCHDAYPLMLSVNRLCPACARALEERDQAVAKTLWRRGRKPGVRVSDGAGCVERIPAWMADWDGNLHG